MATVQVNPIINGLSGKLGRTIVFKNLRGRTIATSFPRPPRKQSEQQRINRNKFREATLYAQTAMLDENRKEYYQKKAKKLNLPNAYTAAITEYMRSPQLEEANGTDKEITDDITKNDVEVKKVDTTTTEGNRSDREIGKTEYHQWGDGLMPKLNVITNAKPLLTMPQFRLNHQPELTFYKTD